MTCVLVCAWYLIVRYCDRESYERDSSIINFRKWCKRFGLSCVSIFITCGLVYTWHLMVRSSNLYDYARKNPRAGVAPIYKADPVLGYVHVPNSRGFDILPIEARIPAWIDEHGFRVPVDGQETKHRPLILALGCSFTYGAVCLAEDTYPHKLAQLLGGSELNAGVSGYGLAQMLIAAERLIPEYKPDYVVVQYSHWLLDRSLKEFAPVRFALQPVPYFTDGNDGSSISIAPPVFETAAFRADLEKYHNVRRTRMRSILFAAEVGLPLLLHDDWHNLQYRLRSLAGLVKRPTRRRGEAIAYAYGRMKNLCAAHNSSLLIVVLGNEAKPEQIPLELTKLDLCIVNAQATLLDRLGHDAWPKFEDVYETFRMQEAAYLSGHPDALAHSIIAETLASRIREMQAGQPK
jgi:hypothetical protein